MNAMMRALRVVDDFQQRTPALAFPLAVWKKFNDDQAGNLAALISYYGFAALFPMLLVLVTVLDIALNHDPALRSSLLNSALSQYPVIGPQLTIRPKALPSAGLPLVIGLVLLLLGARGVAGAMQNAFFEMWGLPQKDRPAFPLSQLIGLGLVFTIGLGFIATTFLAGVVGGAGHLLTGAGAHIGTVVVSLVLNIGLFWLGFRIATAGRVLGLLAWLYLQAEVTLYAAEVDVVLTKRLWPCSLLPDESAEAAPDKSPEAVPDAAGEEPAAVPAQVRTADAGDNRAVLEEKPVPDGSL